MEKYDQSEQDSYHNARAANLSEYIADPEVPTGVKITGLVAILLGLYLIFSGVVYIVLWWDSDSVAHLFSFVYHIITGVLFMVGWPGFLPGQNWGRHVFVAGFVLLLLSFWGSDLMVVSVILFILGVLGNLYIFTSRKAVAYFGGGSPKIILSNKK